MMCFFPGNESGGSYFFPEMIYAFQGDDSFLPGEMIHVLPEMNRMTYPGSPMAFKSLSNIAFP